MEVDEWQGLKSSFDEQTSNDGKHTSSAGRRRKTGFGMGPLAFFRKMGFMTCDTLPASIAIDKNIREAILR
ncbi:MAG: hypothetical protein ABR928_12925, partial [Terracidiphilus sp.]